MDQQLGRRLLPLQSLAVFSEALRPQALVPRPLDRLGQMADSIVCQCHLREVEAVESAQPPQCLPEGQEVEQTPRLVGQIRSLEDHRTAQLDLKGRLKKGLEPVAEAGLAPSMQALARALEGPVELVGQGVGELAVEGRARRKAELVGWAARGM